MYSLNKMEEIFVNHVLVGFEHPKIKVYYSAKQIMSIDLGRPLKISYDKNCIW